MTAHYRVTKDGKFESSEGDTLEAVLAEAKRGTGDACILIHAHGGLVPKAAGLQIAKTLSEPTALGAFGRPMIYPIWRTGLQDALEDYVKNLIRRPELSDILRKLFDWAIDHFEKNGDDSRGGSLSTGERNDFFEQLEKEVNGTAPTAPGPDIKIDDARVGDVTREPKAERDLKESVESSAAIQASAQALEAERDPGARAGVSDADIAKAKTLKRVLAPDLVKEMEDALAAPREEGRSFVSVLLAVFSSRAVKAARACLRRWRTKRDHDVWPTIVEEVARAFLIGEAGAGIWWEMKDDARAHFDQGGDGRVLMKELAKLKSELKKEGRSLALALTGHSAGSIFHSYFLMALANSEDLRDTPVDLVLLAPAVDLELFSLAYAAGIGNGLRSVRIYTMSDAFESQDRLVGALYPRSLLYLISGVLESGEPDDLLLGLERSLKLHEKHLTRKERSRRQSLRKLIDAENGLIFSVTKDGALDGLRSTAESHGIFDQDEATLKSVVHHLKAAQT